MENKTTKNLVKHINIRRLLFTNKLKNLYLTIFFRKLFQNSNYRNLSFSASHLNLFFFCSISHSDSLLDSDMSSKIAFCGSTVLVLLSRARPAYAIGAKIGNNKIWIAGTDFVATDLVKRLALEARRGNPNNNFLGNAASFGIDFANNLGFLRASIIKNLRSCG